MQQKREDAAADASGSNKTLFVRNISYDTTKEDFKEYMEKFGPLKYAVLCKARELQASAEDLETLQHSHKGTGFV